VGLKIKIHKIYKNLLNPVAINRPIVSATCLNQWIGLDWAVLYVPTNTV